MGSKYFDFMIKDNKSNKAEPRHDEYDLFNEFTGCIVKYKKLTEMEQSLNNLIYNKKIIEDKIKEDDEDNSHCLDNKDYFDDTFIVSEIKAKIEIFNHQYKESVKSYTNNCSKFTGHDFSKYKDIDVKKCFKP